VLNPADASAMPDVTASTQMPAYSGASKASAVPFTSGIPTPSAAIATPNGAASGASASSAASSSSMSGIAMPMKTGAVGVAALFGGAAVMMNI
jgi:hypothetical protein